MKKVIVLLLMAGAFGSCVKKEEQRQAAPIAVKVFTVSAGDSTALLRYSGTIEEESGTTVSFASIGTVQSISVAEGQFVAKGQLIGQLDATSATSAYEAALAAKEQAEDALERMKLLHEAGSLPEIKWVEVQTQVRQAVASEQIARKGLADTRLYAPFSGYVASKSIEAGANAAPGMPVVKLVKIDRVKVKVSVPEEEVALFRAGMAITVTVPALGGKAFEARVAERGVSADPLSRTYEVKATIDNHTHELLPGMIAEVAAGDNTQSSIPNLQYPTVPASVVQIDADNRTFVWTVDGGKARKTYITTGANAGLNVTATAGLSAGDSVICEGQQKVSGGMEVEILK